MSFTKVMVDCGGSVLAARDWVNEHVKPNQDERTIIVLKNVESVSDKYFVPLLDRWASRFPGRVFLPAKVAESAVKNSSADLTIPSLIQSRFPHADDRTVYQGRIILSEQEQSYIPLTIQRGVRPERLPVSETLFLVCRLEESDIESANIPLQGAALSCRIEEDLISLNNCVLISPACGDDFSQSRLYFVREETSFCELICMQNEHVFATLYHDAVKVANSGSRKSSFIRGLAVGWHKTKELLGPALFDALVTKKQLNVLRTVELMEQRFDAAFFHNFVVPNQKHPSDALSSNFEHKLLLKRIRACKVPPDQSAVNSLIAQSVDEGSSLTDMVLDGKRGRRTIGTSFNSYRWPNGAVALPLFDGALVSEVIGSQIN